MTARVGSFPWGIAWGLLVLALLTREPPLVIALGLVVVAGGLSELTARVAHEGLRARVRLSASHIVAGEEVVATVEVENAKPLPLTWCELRVALPDGIEPAEAGPGQARNHVSAAFAPGANERVRLRFPLRAVRRGAYAIGAATLRTGDWLGFFSEERDAATPMALVAYPRTLATRAGDVPALRPLAERATRRGLLPDPLRFAGVREHQPRDARKDIHWKTTARLGRLQTRVFEPATSGDVVFLVNVASHPSYWIQADPEAVEVVVAATATLLRTAADAGRQFALVTNGLDALTHERPRALLGRGPAKLRRALEMLARLSPYAGGAPGTIFLREHARMAWGATLVCVTPHLEPELADALLRLRRMDHRVLVATLAEPETGILERCSAHRVYVETLVFRWIEAAAGPAPTRPPTSPSASSALDHGGRAGALGHVAS